MTEATSDWAQVNETLGLLRRELARLGERVTALEGVAKVAPPAPTAPTSVVSEEVLLIISAAVAAFLGKKPKIRQIRLLGSTAWSQQGRLTIQGSHTL
jgi:methylmalonyl-CoA carboxyltransferase large subunit